ncbi:Usp domain-containing protein [Heracleum sosnowskyi]|uniref:Usp domain-containing protein n=1 Tax=Heracleum sosnowskyi TaxID=360622 RepID=A0AAD8LWR0_9APIA|nr:Usp domain-containing protein [Heracleum sosnowskyi]
MEAERRVGVAIDFSECSNKALRWAVDNVGRNGDHLILLYIQPQGFYEEGEMQLWETTGSPLIPSKDLSDPDVMKKYGVKPDAETLDIVNNAASQKEFVVLMKIYWGDAREKLCEAVDEIPLDCLVIGNRGFGKLKRAIMGSVSNYVVNSAHCPVTVVKDQRE